MTVEDMMTMDLLTDIINSGEVKNQSLLDKMVSVRDNLQMQYIEYEKYIDYQAELYEQRIY